MQASATIIETNPRRVDDGLERRGTDAYAAEFIGTFLLTLFICFAITMNSSAGLGFTDWSVIGLVQFLVLTVMVHSVGHASGAHFNPAVTATLAALRKIAPIDAAIYVVLQLLGALLAALVVKLVLSDEGDATGYGAPRISDQFLDGKLAAGFLVELIGAFVLMWAIMGVAVNPKGARDWAGLVIGGAFGLAVFALGPLTGGSFNPARAFGPSLVGGGEPVGEFLVAYVLGPIIGALLAGVAYQALVLGPEHRRGRRPVDTLSGVESGRNEGETLIETPPRVLPPDPRP